jgi:hypothetical protein
MPLAWVLSALSDFAVSAQVKSVNVPGKCAFGSGFIVPTTPQSYNSTPNNQDWMYNTISQALLTSVRNGGKKGILRKVNGDLKFRANDFDIIGGWTCEADGKPSLNFTVGTDPNEIEDTLLAMGRISRPYWGCWVNLYNGTSAQQLFWSTTVDNSGNTNGGMRFTVNTAQSAQDPLSMVGSVCRMNASSVQWVFSRIDIYKLEQDWCLRTAGDIYDPTSSASPEDIVERVLDSMIMTTYGAFMSVPDSTQGCLITMTRIPWLVCALLLIVTIMFVVLAALCVWMYGYIFSRRKNLADPNRWVIENMPHGLDGWMEHAIRNSEHGMLTSTILDFGSMEVGDFRHWRFGPIGSDVVSYELYLAKDSADRQMPKPFMRQDSLMEEMMLLGKKGGTGDERLAHR